MTIIGTLMGKYRPTVNVLIEPTNDCQLHCVTCYRLGGRKIGYMDIDTFRLALSQLPRTILVISLNGAGEPLLHPMFQDMVNIVNSKRTWLGTKYKTAFSTNGLLLDTYMQDEIVNKIDWINVSLDDGLGKTYEKRRIGSNWEIVTRNTRELINRRRKRTKVSVSLTRLNHTNKEIQEFNNEWKLADKIIINNWHNAQMHVPGNIHQNNCQQIYTTTFVCWDGSVTTCCGDLRGDNICGNIHETPLRKLKRHRGPLCRSCDHGGYNEQPSIQGLFKQGEL